MTLKDNWQGEFSVALFGAVGWAVSDIYFPFATLMQVRPQFVVLNDILPRYGWTLWFIVFAVVQLAGLRLINARGRFLRIIGATGICIGLTCVCAATLLKTPFANSIPAYLVCIFIEFCAIIFHTAYIVRFQEYPKWRLMSRH